MGTGGTSPFPRRAAPSASAPPGRATSSRRGDATSRTDPILRAIIRLAKQFISLSPVFEVFATQISAHSIISNLTFGGARYIATGRGFATTRISFAILYSRFAGPSIYLGMRTLTLLLYVSLSVWIPHLICAYSLNALPF